MPVTDDLRAVAERAHRELRNVLDFFEHSRFVWRAFQHQVSQGHRESVTNLATGTTIDTVGLAALAPAYARNYLLTFTFRHCVSIFEAFLFDFLHRLLLHNPWQFADRQLNFRAILEAGSREEVVSEMIRKQLNELRYDHLREWFAAINKTVKLDCPTTDEIDTLAEIKATRDVLEHNAGIANEVYRRKAGKKARYAVGDAIEIEYTYHLDSWSLIRKVVADVSALAITRLSGP